MRNATISKFPEQTNHRGNVASAVRAHMGVRQIRDAALAREVGMSQSAMSRRTNGDTAFDVDELGRIARYFDLGLAELITMPKPQSSDYRAMVSDLAKEREKRTPQRSRPSNRHGNTGPKKRAA